MFLLDHDPTGLVILGDGLAAGLTSSTTGRPSTETIEAQDAEMRQADAIIIGVRQRMYFPQEFGAFGSACASVASPTGDCAATAFNSRSRREDSSTVSFSTRSITAARASRDFPVKPVRARKKP